MVLKAKKYASERGLSLSELVQNHLLRLMEEKKEEFEITPLVKSLSGILDRDEDFGKKDMRKIEVLTAEQFLKSC